MLIRNTNIGQNVVFQRNMTNIVHPPEGGTQHIQHKYRSLEGNAERCNHTRAMHCNHKRMMRIDLTGAIRHIHTLDEQCDYGENSSQCDYDEYTSHANEFSFNVVDTSISRRNQAYASLKIQLCNTPGINNFTLKVDTGVQANTMPFRTFRDMFPEQLDNVGIPFAHCLQPT